jgi:uncharacterized protein YndB with AHSA1/START domain
MGASPRVDVRVSQRFDISPDRVFNAWIDPGVAGRWLFATASRPLSRVTIDARPGGSFHFQEKHRIEHTGKYIEVARPRRLVFTLSADSSRQDMPRVSIEIVPLEAGCKLTLTHENVPPDDARRTEGRWIGMLYGLGKTLREAGAKAHLRPLKV